MYGEERGTRQRGSGEKVKGNVVWGLGGFSSFLFAAWSEKDGEENQRATGDWTRGGVQKLHRRREITVQSSERREEVASARVWLIGVVDGWSVG